MLNVTMSFTKAMDLIRLARMATRRTGVTLDEITDEFGVSHRTAQRMAAALEHVFEGVSYEDGLDRRRRWRISSSVLRGVEARQDAAIEALELAEKSAVAEGRVRHARALRDLRDSLLIRLGEPKALRTEADVEAVVSAIGGVARPGPRAQLDSKLVDTLIASLRGPCQLNIRYGGPSAPQRIVEPHGLLFGNRGYLVARDAGGDPTLRKLRLDRIHDASMLDVSFPMDPTFDLERYAARGFGVFSDESQYGEVIWRFAPAAAGRAAQFTFHPDQTLEHQADGSLIVRFYAAGWTEMTWHLYQWGDKVDVIAPVELREMVEGHRRSDFQAMP